MKFLSDVEGTITDIEGDNERRESLSKYVVLTEDGDFFISGITHAELVKLAGQIVAVAMQQTMLHTTALAPREYAMDDIQFAREFSVMMTTPLSYEGRF